MKTNEIPLENLGIVGSITNSANKVGLNAAYLYYVLTEYSDLSKEEMDEEGYIELDAMVINYLTSLSRPQQNLAIDKLVKAGYIDVKKKGAPATKCFKVLK